MLLWITTSGISAKNIGGENTNISILSSENSNVPTSFWGAVSYNMNDPEVIVDAHIEIGSYERIEIQNGIVSSCEINGNHLYLTISQENFMDHIYKRYKDQGFWDLQVNIMDDASAPWTGTMPVLVRIVVIRIIFG